MIILEKTDIPVNSYFGNGTTSSRLGNGLLTWHSSVMHLKVLDNSVWCQESFQLPNLLLAELKRETLAFFTLGHHQYWWLYIVHYIWVEAWILLYNISDIVLPFKHVKDFMCLSKFWKNDLDGIMQKRHNSIANALELRISCSNPSMCNGIKKNGLLLYFSILFNQFYVDDQGTYNSCL